MAYDAEHASHLTRDPLTITEPRERLEYLRDFLRTLPPERFDMRSTFLRGERTYWEFTGDESEELAGTFARSCGTAACIAGWAITVFQPTRAVTCAINGLDDLLGLRDGQDAALFCPPGFSDAGRYTHSMAVRVLDHLLKTGEVDWGVASAEGTEAATPVSADPGCTQ